MSKKRILKIEGEEFDVRDAMLLYKWGKFAKKRIPIIAIEMERGFEVKTMEGIMKGKTGDYLIKGIKGEFYPCDKKIFEESYEFYSEN